MHTQTHKWLRYALRLLGASPHRGRQEQFNHTDDIFILNTPRRMTNGMKNRCGQRVVGNALRPTRVFLWRISYVSRLSNLRIQTTYSQAAEHQSIPLLNVFSNCAASKKMEA
jgi:hypothetical protein